MNKKSFFVILVIIVALGIGYYAGTQRNASDTPRLAAASRQSPVTSEPALLVRYVYNKNTHKFHYPNCSSVNDMSDRNKVLW